MLPQYYMHSDVCNMYESSTTLYCVIRRERVKYIMAFGDDHKNAYAF